MRARARGRGTLTSAARARDTRVQSLVELVFGTRLGPVQRSTAHATQPGDESGSMASLLTRIGVALGLG